MVENMPITLYPTIINPMRERCLIGFQRNRRKRISKRAGFSLLELVIVGAILLITTAMAVPIFQNVRRTYQLRGAVVDLASLLQRSRMFCVRNNRLVPIQTAGGNTQVFLDSFCEFHHVRLIARQWNDGGLDRREVGMKMENRSLLAAFELLLLIGIHQERKRDAIHATRWLDHIWRQMLV